MLHRLDEVRVEAGFAGLLPIFVMTPTGHGYQHHVLAPRLRANLASRVITADDR